MHKKRPEIELSTNQVLLQLPTSKHSTQPNQQKCEHDTTIKITIKSLCNWYFMISNASNNLRDYVFLTSFAFRRACDASAFREITRIWDESCYSLTPSDKIHRRYSHRHFCESFDLRNERELFFLISTALHDRFFVCTCCNVSVISRYSLLIARSKFCDVRRSHVKPLVTALKKSQARKQKWVLGVGGV